METTRLSTKGQIILPKSIRVAKAWTPGTEFTVEEIAGGVLLRPTLRFPRTSLADVAGCLRPKRKAKDAAQEPAAIRREVLRPVTAVDTNVLVRLPDG